MKNKITSKEIRQILEETSCNIYKTAKALERYGYQPSYQDWCNDIRNYFPNIEINDIEWSPEVTYISLTHYTKAYGDSKSWNYNFEYKFSGFYDKYLDRIYGLDKIPNKVEYLVFRGDYVPFCIKGPWSIFGLGRKFGDRCIKVPVESFITEKIILNIMVEAD